MADSGRLVIRSDKSQQIGSELVAEVLRDVFEDALAPTELIEMFIDDEPFLILPTAHQTIVFEEVVIEMVGIEAA